MKGQKTIASKPEHEGVDGLYTAWGTKEALETFNSVR